MQCSLQLIEKLQYIPILKPRISIPNFVSQLWGKIDRKPGFEASTFCYWQLSRLSSLGLDSSAPKKPNNTRQQAKQMCCILHLWRKPWKPPFKISVFTTGTVINAVCSLLKETIIKVIEMCIYCWIDTLESCASAHNAKRWWLLCISSLYSSLIRTRALSYIHRHKHLQMAHLVLWKSVERKGSERQS